MQTADWWESEGGFFGDIYREADNSLEGFLNAPQDLIKRTEREARGVVKLCGLKAGDTILDCPCGYGRHSLRLAQMGFMVTGVDINDRFLTVCDKTLQELKLTNCLFKKKDMRFLDYENEFDAVINMFYSFGFFDTDEENAAVAKNFCRALKPGGKFLMHTHITLPKIIQRDYKMHEIRTLSSGNKLELFRHYDPQTKRETGQWFLLKPDGTKETSSVYSVRIYGTEEFVDLCKSAGFRDVHTYGDWDGTPYEGALPLLIVVANK